MTICVLIMWLSFKGENNEGKCELSKWTIMYNSEVFVEVSDSFGAFKRN